MWSNAACVGRAVSRVVGSSRIEEMFPRRTKRTSAYKVTRKPYSGKSRAEAERHNSAQWINRLPIELLSRIFTTGDQLDQLGDDEIEEESDLEFQEIVVQVCRHWRTVALNMPMLWSYITMAVPIPYHRTALFLSRAGPTIPLEIELDMTDEFMSGLEEYDSYTHADRATKALEFIVAHGGVASRWEILKVWCELPSVMLAIIDFMADASLDNLRTLELGTEFDNMALVDDLSSEALVRRDLSQSVMFRKPPPVLRHLELIGIPSGFLFAHESTALVSNLTHLELGTVLALPPLMGLRELFIKNPRLESLALDMSTVGSTDFQHVHASATRISMPYLRRFSLHEPMSTAWAVDVLMMVDAPGVEKLSLSLRDTVQPELPGIVAAYIAFGRRDGRLKDHFVLENPHKEDAGPIYPALQRLTVGNCPDVVSVFSLVHMVRSFENITRLDWELEDSPGDALLQTIHGKSCPRLEHLRVYGVRDQELHQYVQMRIQQGVPLKVVEINSRDWDKITEPTKKYLKSVLERFEPYVDSFESDSDDDPDDSDDSDSDSESNGSISSESEGWTDTDLADEVSS